jgi:hypothetical protein
MARFFRLRFDQRAWLVVYSAASWYCSWWIGYTEDYI